MLEKGVGYESRGQVCREVSEECCGEVFEGSTLHEKKCMFGVKLSPHRFHQQIVIRYFIEYLNIKIQTILADLFHRVCCR